MQQWIPDDPAADDDDDDTAEPRRDETGGPARQREPGGEKSLRETRLTAQALPTTDRTGVTGKTVSLPKGEATLRGLEDSFSAQLSTGVATFSVPFDLPAPRGQLPLTLGLSYSSGSGQGTVGMGFALGVPFIARQTDRGSPHYEDLPGFDHAQDRFVFSGGQELVPLCVVGAAGECPGLIPAGQGPEAEQLPAWAAGSTLFRPRVEGEYLRFFLLPGRRSWRVQSLSGVTLEFGARCGSSDDPALERDPASPSGSPRIFRWWLRRAWDLVGQSQTLPCPNPTNTVEYGYERTDADGGTSRLTDIWITSPVSQPATAPTSAYAHHVRLVYEPRPDPSESYRSGWRMAQTTRLARVELASRPAGAGTSGDRRYARSWVLGYDSSLHQSFLTSVTLRGRCPGGETAQPPEANGALPATLGCVPLSHPPTTFEYGHVQGYLARGAAAGRVLAGYEALDERVKSLGGSPPHSLDEQQTTLQDVDADGLPDVLVTAAGLYGGKHGVFWNRGEPGTPTFVAGKIGVDGSDDAGVITLGNPNVAPLDLNGDGSVDLLHMPLVKTYSVYAAQERASGWWWVGRDVTTADSLSPRVDLGRDADRTRVVDVDFDGLVDVVRSTGTELQTYFALGRLPGGDGRFGRGRRTGVSSATLDPEPATGCVPWSGTALSFDSPDVHLADMNGDGITDLVRVRPGDLRYWPGRGNGVWGTGDRETCPGGTFAQGRDVAVDDAPYYAALDERALRLDDVNGDGLADLVQIGFDEVEVWLNVDGRAFTDGHRIEDMPANPSTGDRVRLADVDGSGTVDLVWGDGRSYRYVALAGPRRPGLLTQISNGLGRVTTLEYEPSTAQMLAAAKAGSPWQRRAPLVTQVVSRVTVTAGVTVAGRAPAADVTEYRYRDPVYDGRQREFRGFSSTTVRRVGDATSPEESTESSFLLGECPTAADAAGMVCTLDDNPREALKGRPWLVERRDAAGRYHSTADTRYQLRPLYRGLDGRTVTDAVTVSERRTLYDVAGFVVPAATSVETTPVVEVQSAPAPRNDTARPPSSAVTVLSLPVPLRASSGHARLLRTAHFDWYGSRVWEDDWGCVAGGACAGALDEVFSTPSTHGIKAQDWLRTPGRSERQGDGTRHRGSWDARIQTFGPTGRPLYHRRWYSDGVRLSRTQGGTTPAPDATAAPGTQTAWLYVESTTLDARGNVIKTVDTGASVGDPARSCRTIAWDPDYGDLATRETVYASDGCTGTALSTEILTWDRGLGLPLLVRDPSGATSRFEYDGLGRLTAVHRADPATGAPSVLPSLQAEYFFPDASRPSLSVVHVSSQDGASVSSADATESWAYVDGLGRTVTTLREAACHAFVVSGLTAHDAKGAPAARYLDHFFDGPPTAFSVASEPALEAEAGEGLCTSGETQGRTVFPARQQHDAFGRVVDQWDTGGVRTLHQDHHALETDAWDAADLDPASLASGTYVTERVDGHGLPSRTVERFHDGAVLRARLTALTQTPLGKPDVIQRGLCAAPDCATLLSSTSRYIVYDDSGRMVLNAEPSTTPGYALTTIPNGDPPGAFQAHDARYASLSAWRYQYDRYDQLVGVSDARGCGANYRYDRAGRLVSVDLFPCDAAGAPATMPPYSAPSPSTGTPTAGVEVLYEYDQPSGAGAPAGFAFGSTLGRLVRIRDRARHAVFSHDYRGRITEAATQVVKSNTPFPADSLASRYAPTWYRQARAFDAADRLVTQTTDGPGGSPFSTTLTYDAAGALARVGSSFDPAPAASNPLLEIGCRTADGLATSLHYGDAADTQTVYRHDARRRLTTATTFRSPPAGWPAGDTAMQLLEDTTFQYDAVSNPVCLADGRDPAEWPAGSEPASRQFTYDSLNRVTSVTTAHHTTLPLGASALADTWVSPNAEEDSAWVAPPALPEIDPRRALPAPHVTFDRRPVTQGYAYDYLGNLTSSTDDQAGFFDRSLGAQVHQSSAPYRLDSASIAAGTRAGALQATYDAAGNLLTLAVRRSGPCSRPTGCSHVFRYEWDELSRLTRARRWDFTSLPNPAAPPATPDSAVAADLRYRYDADDARVVKTSTVAPEAARHTLYVFGDLEYRRLTYATDYDHQPTLRTPILTANGTRLARVLHDPTLPESSTDATRVFIALPDHLGSTTTVIDQRTGELVEATTW
ncbi:MAG: hypothetical protein FJ104_01305, partial [Deltaproteobacteria bacterium]|nr:hypothetical protein [Deltaproteobacteria bacterium]